jgi:hypothetical protein
MKRSTPALLSLATVLGCASHAPPGASVECSDDPGCSGKCATQAADLGATVSPPTTFVASECLGGEPPPRGASFWPARGCVCYGDESSFILLDPDVATGCMVWGRVGQCLYGTREFPGCNPEAATTSCAAVCDELQRRIQADEASSYEVTAQGAACLDGSCVCVLDMDGDCYVRGCLANPHMPYDCSRSARSIVDEACPAYPR